MPECTACRFFEMELNNSSCPHTNRPGGLAITQQAVNFCGFPRGSRILDVACGTGTTLNYLTHQQKLSAVGLDISWDILQMGRSKHSGLIQVQADATSIPLEDGSCDAVIVECALSLTGKVDKTIGEIRRVLRPAGRLIITDIFIRELKDAAGLDCLAGSDCLSGVMTEELISGILIRNGFFQKFWQDYTNELKKWMAEMVFKLGSLKTFYNLLGFREDRVITPGENLSSRIKLGYYLLVAEKKIKAA